MSRVRRLRRRAGHDAAIHERARGLSAERLDGPLDGAEATWLEDHLIACASCRSVALEYEMDRASLRGLRERQPEPPRDLWARTSAAIERESIAAGRSGAGAGASARRSGRRSPALGVMSGVAVIAVVIGATAMSGGFLGGPTPIITDAGPSTPPVAVTSPGAQPGPTPIAVGAGNVGWLGTAADGALAYNVTKVDQVCAAGRQPDCAPVSDRNSKRVEMSVRPKSISQSPVRNQAVVVGTDKAGDDAVLVIALPTAEPAPTASPVATPAPTATPDATAKPSVQPSDAPSTSPDPSASPAATPVVTPAPTATPVTTPVPTVSPEPTVAATLAIVTGVKVVGQSAAYSPDGAWFAFSARPSDASAGPDIYVWHVGDKTARPLTTDHASVFGSWAGSLVIGSRPVADAAAASTTDRAAESFLLDPATGSRTDLKAAGWRPVVDPAGHWAVTWDGTVALTADTITYAPATGSLVVRPYVAGVGPDLSASTGSVVETGSVADYDARWDETGTWFAVWLADPSDASIGRLSLLRLDPATGTVSRPHGAPKDVTALPGFSIADGRLAWATPPGQGGEGSRVQIVAWTGDTVGTVESGPVEDVVVVH